MLQLLKILFDIKLVLSAINKQYKHSPEVRAYLAKCKRDYRAKQKQKAAEATIGPETPAAKNSTPEEANPTNAEG